MTEKKKFWDTNFWKITKTVLLNVLPALIKAKAPFIKTEQDKRNVDDGADVLRKM